MTAHDIAIVGAGVAGSAAALACAARGQRVLLVEEDPVRATSRHTGEWLHPAATDALEQLGVELRPPVSYATGKGYVVFPDDGTEPIVLPYPIGQFGNSLEHALLVETLRAEAQRHAEISYVPNACATRVDGGVLSYERGARTHTARVSRVAAAVGPGTRLLARGVGQTLAFASIDRPPTHRTASLTLHGVSLPFEGYLHVFVGGAGPALAYRIGPSRVRLLLDVPLSLPIPRSGGVALYEAFAPALASPLDDAMRHALGKEAPTWCARTLRPRGELSRFGVPLLGDAAGSLHPLTAADISLALGDALGLARHETTAAWERDRRRAGRVPETVAVGLGELFTDPSPEIVAIRRATYRMWREEPSERLRSMGFMAGEGDGLFRFGRACFRVMGSSARALVEHSVRKGEVGDARALGARFVKRVGWMLGGSLGVTEALPASLREHIEERGSAAARYGAALSRGAAPRAEVVGLPGAGAKPTTARAAIARGVRALSELADDQGSFEGEVRGDARPTAEYVLAMHATGRRFEPAKSEALLHTIEAALAAPPGDDDAAGAKIDPDQTRLLYAAARLLGRDKDDARLTHARSVLREHADAPLEPSARLWLALAGIGTHASGVPEEPGAAAWLVEHGAGARPCPRARALEDERVAPQQASGASARTRLADLRRPVPTITELRAELVRGAHLGRSPQDSLLSIVALSFHDPDDVDATEACARFESWMWGDEHALRVAPARSGTRDTVGALQALRAAAPLVDVAPLVERVSAHVQSQQRRDDGAFSAAGIWHHRPDARVTGEALAASHGLDSRLASTERAASFLLSALERIAPDDMLTESAALRGLSAIADAGGSPPRIEARLNRAREALLVAQRPDGSFACPDGFVRGTAAGIEALLAAGAPSYEPAIRRACAWLLERQRADGAWGERASTSGGHYAADERGCAIQTGHALIALCAAREADFAALVRGARWLAASQRPQGDWRDAVLPPLTGPSHELDATVIPLRALGLAVQRADEREQLARPAAPRSSQRR